MLLDFSAYLDVHVGPYVGFFEGLCHMNARLAHLKLDLSHLNLRGGSVFWTKATQWVAQDQPVHALGRGLTGTNDPGRSPDCNFV